MARSFWLLKSEPSSFSFEDLLASPGKTTVWDGVRNYQARNLMRDKMHKGDRAFFYHSNADPPGIAGIVEIVREAYPDPTQFDPKDPHHDPRSPHEDPRWVAVDVRAVDPLPRFLSLPELRGESRLEGMELLRRGSRLSVQPVTAGEWKAILGLSRRAVRGSG